MSQNVTPYLGLHINSPLATETVATGAPVNAWETDLNFEIIDAAIQSLSGGSGGTSVKVNGSTVSTPNFNASTPAAPAASVNITWQVAGSSVSAYVPAAPVTSVFGRTGAVTAQANDYTSIHLLNLSDDSGDQIAFNSGIELLDLAGSNINLGGDSNIYVTAEGGSIQLLSTATALTPLASDNSTNIATTAFVKAQGYVLNTTTVNGHALSANVVVSASDLTTGTLGLAYGGTNADLSASGGSTFVLAQDASHVITARALVAADIPNISAAKVTSGTLALAQGGTNADLSATGGATFVLAQNASHVITARALVSADIPNNAANTSGTAANLSGTPALPNGTTATTQTVGDNSTKLATDAFVLGQGFVTAATAPVTSVFTRTGAVTAQTGDYTPAQVGAVSASVMTTLGDILYENATPTAARLAGNTTTTKQYLSQTGNGSASAAPSWAQIAIGDLANVAGGTVLGNTGTSSGAVAATIAPVLGIPGTSTGTLALASSTASGKFTITAPASAATPTLTLPTTSNVLAGQFAGDGTVLSSTLAVASAAGTVTAALANAGAGTVLGNATGSSAAPTYITTPVLGLPGTSTGSIALASSTASGKFTVTAPASAATPTLTLPTTSNVLAGQFAGDNVLYSNTPVGASAAGTLSLPTLSNQTANTVFSGPSSAGPSAPTFRVLVAADIPNTTITPIWNNLQNATGALTLANGTNATTFNQTSNVAWLWANTTVATSGTTNASPLHEFAANYWTGAASAQDLWTIGSSLAAGTNGISTLTFTHSGSAGTPVVSVPKLAVTTLGYISLQGSGTEYSAFSVNASSDISVWQSTNFAQPSIVIQSMGGNNNTNYAQLTLSNANSLVNTSGTIRAVDVGNAIRATTGVGIITYAPTSGNCNFQTLAVSSVVNQTGGANGTVTQIMVNAKETAVVGTHNLFDLQAGSAGTTSELTINNKGLITNYNAITTVSNGVPSELAKSDLTAQSAAITATTLYATTATGMYRISWSADITTASDISSVLGGSGGFQVLYTSPTDSVVKTTVPGNSVTSTANTTGTAVGGCEVVYAKTGTNIQFTYGYTDSHTSVGMQYELHIKVEAL